jgi:hypothetical protein
VIRELTVVDDITHGIEESIARHTSMVAAVATTG